MKNPLRHVILLVACAGFLSLGLVGCKRAPVIPKTSTTGPRLGEKDVFSIYLDSVRYNAGSSDDWTRFRDALQPVANYFAKPDLMARLRLADDDRKFLQTETHLSEAELVEVEAASFRKADAHYLDECFLLRDIDQVLQNSNLLPIEQAQQHFRWTMRNVFLHEQVDDWIPPAFILRRGFGSAVDRAIVFLALLRQARLDGCLLMVPESDPPQFLVGVMEPRTSNLRLFDARLGLAVRGKDGQGIATLQEALADPVLLKPSGITPEQAKKLEAWLICPLYALAPRMKELQEGFKAHDPIVLHLDARKLAQDIGKASNLPVKVWNPPLQGKTLANSPARELWMFLPKTEGGLDDGFRTTLYARIRVPFAGAVANLAPLNVTEGILLSRAWSHLMGLQADLFNKYDIQPREMYLRGLYAPMFRRHDRLGPFVNSEMLKGLPSDKEFVRKEVPAWIDKVRNAFANVDPDDPKQRAKLLQANAAIWGADAFIGTLLEVDKDEQFDRAGKIAAMEKTELTKILAIASRDYFDFELARLQACAEHEKAERAQVALQTAKAPGEGTKKRAAEAWLNAKSAWGSLYLARFSPKTKIEQYAFAHRFVSAPGEFELRLALLEALHQDLQKYFNAKLRLAECMAYTEATGSRAAAAYLEEAKSEIEALQSKALFTGEINQFNEMIRQFPPPIRAKFQERLDLLARDWSERGNYYWLKQQIDQRNAAAR